MNIPNWMKYLRKLLAIVDNGTIILGKYAFPNIPTLPTKVLLVEVNAVLKKFQLIIPAIQNNMFGIPSVEMPAIVPKNKVKTSVVKIGGITIHKGPKIVCLY